MTEQIGDTAVFLAPAPPPKINGDSMNGGLQNGIANGKERSSSSSSSHHKSSSKDKHRDKDRDHKSSKHSSSSSSSSSSKHRHSSSSSSSRDKDKDRSVGGSSSSSSHKSSNRDKDRDKHRDKDKQSSSSSSSTNHHSSSGGAGGSGSGGGGGGGGGGGSSSSSSKDKDRHRDKDKDKHRDKDGDKKRDKEKSSSSSSSKDKERSSSSSNKDLKNSQDKDKHSSSSTSRSDKDKDRHKSSSSSSTSKNKHSSSSSGSSSKHRDKSSSGSHHHSSSSKSSRSGGGDSKDRHKTSSSSSSTAAATTSATNEPKVRKNQIEDDDDDDDVKIEIEEDPLIGTDEIQNNHISNNGSIYKPEPINVSQASSCDYSMSQFNPNESQFVIKAEQSNDDDDDEEDEDNAKSDVQNNGGGEGNGRSYDDEQTQHPIKRELSNGVGNNIDDDDDEEDDIPISKRQKLTVKEEASDDEDDVPLTARKRVKKEKVNKKGKKKKYEESEGEEEDDDYENEPIKKKIKKEKKIKIEKVVPKQQIKQEGNTPTKVRKKKEDEQQEVWKWWEEEKREDGVKWHYLEHKGPVFAPPYEPLPDNVTFEYDGKSMKLSQDSEEIACFYAKMLNHDFTTKDVFNDNFFTDWRKSMTSKEKEKITKLKNCNFNKMHIYFQSLSEKNKTRTKDQKLQIKNENEALMNEYGFCTIDGHKEKIGNFRIEPPGLFRGRGEHPKMGKIKRRVMPEDILINCSKDSKIPQPPKGHRWREVKHDNSVTWLASWTENVQGQVKYVMLNPSSKLKGEKDWQKYETARRLHKHIDKIRNTYRDEWKSKEMRVRQRAVALYFIDKLALRAGNEKDEDQADTVGCCSLRVEHIELHKSMNGKENVVVFDFLGKDSIRYYNEVEVEKRVFKNLELFKENKKDGDDLFDRLNTTVMNEHLRELMEGLTAKVFRTYNASWTLQCQLNEMTDPDSSLPEKLLAYNRANRAVAILCNHQRAVPKSHEKSMENLKEKIRAKRDLIDDSEQDVRDAIKSAKRGSVKEKMVADKKKKQLERLKEQLKKLELQETDRDENKTIALGTSKLNYLDPRISVAWCKKYDVPIDKIYNKTQRDKFRWAIDMATEDYVF